MAAFEPKNSKRIFLSILRSILLTLVIVAAVYFFGGVPTERIESRFVAASFHAPDWERLLRAGAAVRFHLGAAVLALIFGAMQFALPEGTSLHRAVGALWLLLMVAAAVSSFFLRNIRPGHFSAIHGLSLLALIAVPWIVYTARTGRLSHHRNTVIGLYVGGLVLAGALAFLPGRMLWSMVFD